MNSEAFRDISSMKLNSSSVKLLNQNAADEAGNISTLNARYNLMSFSLTKAILTKDITVDCNHILTKGTQIFMRSP
jgi:hypothetical protein